MEPNASLLVTLAIPALALIVLVAVGVAITSVTPPAQRRRHLAIYVAGALAWVAFTFVLAGSGLLARFDARPPPLLLLLVPTIGLPLALACSPLGARLRGAPLAWLIGFHAFRLPLELVMHQAAAEGTMPGQMSYSGVNFDIVTGITAILVGGLAWAGRAPRWLVLGWNALGTALLVAIVGIAVASLPVFHAFGDAPARVNTWIAFAPFQLLPAVMVAGALLGHAVLWRRTLS